MQVPRVQRVRMWLVVWAACCWTAAHSHAQAAEPVSGPDVVRVMSFNLWHGGDAGGQPLEQTVAVIRASRADVVGLQETHGEAEAGQARPDRAARLAETLGWHYVDQGDRTGIISRYRVVATTPRKWGVKLELPSGAKFYSFNAHFAASPYQPYQLLGIPYGDAPFLTGEQQAIRAAQAARGAQVARLMTEVQGVLAEGLPAFITGDFNEPSHRDWTDRAAQARLCPLKVEWPSTRAVETAGFLDTYRLVHADPIQRPGCTWTPITRITDPQDRHDRIDFVFVGNAQVQVRKVMVVGESAEFADLVVTPYPSDHRAVVAEVELVAAAAAQR